MTTLVIRKGSGNTKQVFFGSRGDWVVTDESSAVATARNRPGSDRLDIEAGARSFSADFPGLYGSRPERKFTVTDAETGERVVEGARIPEGDPQIPVREKWAISLSTGDELAWLFKTDPPETGFYDSAGEPVMEVDHNVPGDWWSGGGGTLRLLMKMWGAAAKTTEQYAARFDEDAITSHVPAEEAPVLALVGMCLLWPWDAKSRDGSIGYTA
jgi:hypothetical protein